MVRLIIFVSTYLFLSGCTYVAQKPISSDLRNKVMSEKMAVVFIDPGKRIHYEEDHYLVFTVLKIYYDSAYEGIWDSEIELSKVHSEHLARLGIDSRSICDVLNITLCKELIVENILTNKSLYEKKSVDIMKGPVLDSSLSTELRKKGMSRLMLITSSGYTLIVPTLGLNPREGFKCNYYLYDLSNNSLIWSGAIAVAAPIDIIGSSAKEYVENDDLKVMKSEVIKLIAKQYVNPDKPDVTVGKLSGLQN